MYEAEVRLLDLARPSLGVTWRVMYVNGHSVAVVRTGYAPDTLTALRRAADAMEEDERMAQAVARNAQRMRELTDRGM